MTTDRKMSRAARTALTQCLHVKAREKLLIVANPEYQRIGEALFQEGLSEIRFGLL